MTSLIEGLCARNLQHLVVDIFLGVSSRDLLSVKLVCQGWRNFVHEWIEHSVPGRKRLKQKLLANWREPTPIWKSHYSLECSLFDLKWDADELFMGTDDGRLLIVNRATTRETYRKKISASSSMIQLDFNADHIVAISEDAHTVLFRRNPNQVVFKLNRRSPDQHKGSLWGVHIWQSLVATGASDGSIHVYQIKAKSLKLLRILRQHTRSVSHLEFDHGLIVSGSQDRRVKVYDYEKSTMVRSWTCPFDILCVTFAHPIVAACSNQEMGENGVHIWSLDQELEGDSLRYLKFSQTCLDMKMTSTHLAIAISQEDEEEEESLEDDDLLSRYTLKVWSLPDLIRQEGCPPLQEIEATYDGEASIHLDDVSLGFTNVDDISLLNFWR